MSIVEATRPPTSTCAPLPKAMPLGLTRNTRPLAEMLPRISEGMPPTTRFNTVDEAEGWLNTTYSLLPTENCCQLIAAECELWLITSVPAFGALIVAWPATTWPPAGLAAERPGASTLARVSGQRIARRPAASG